jgi:hypothetical protein
LGSRNLTRITRDARLATQVLERLLHTAQIVNATIDNGNHAFLTAKTPRTPSQNIEDCRWKIELLYGGFGLSSCFYSPWRPWRLVG